MTLSSLALLFFSHAAPALPFAAPALPFAATALPFAATAQDGPDVQGLLDVAGTSAAARRALAEAVRAELPAARVLEVEPALADPDPLVRAAIARLFGRGDLGSSARPERIAALDALVRRDPAEAVRRAALESLGAIGDDGAARALTGLLDAATTAADRVRAAEALVDAPAGAPFVVAYVGAALGGTAPAGAYEPEVVGALLPRYGRWLADVERPERQVLVPLIVGLRHPSPRIRAAASVAIDRAVLRFGELDASGRATELFGRLAALGLDPALALYQSARISLVADNDPVAALARAEELIALRGLWLSPSARIDAYESQLWLYRGLALRGAAELALGRFERAEATLDEAAEVLDRGLSERRDLASESERLRHADLLLQRAVAELLRTTVALARGVDSTVVLERARRVHTIHLEAQAIAAEFRGDAITGFDNLLLSDLAPHRLLLDGRGDASGAPGALGRRRLIELSAGLGRALSTVAPGELPGFLPRIPGTLPEDVRARLVDPLADPERELLLRKIRRARIDGLDDVIEEAQDLFDLMSQRSLGLVPEEEYETLDLLRRQRYVLMRTLEEEEPGERNWLRDLRIPSSAALWLAEDLTEQGRADEARELAEQLERDIDARGISNWWYVIGHDRVIRARMLVGSSLTDAGRGAEAETVLLGALQRIEDLERELRERGTSEADLAGLRDLRANALVSLAVNANVRLGQPEKATEYYERAYGIRKDEFMRTLLACYRARAGRAEEARALVRTIRPGPGTWYNLACTYALLGEEARALDLLEDELTRNHSTEESRERQKAWAREDPDFESLRGVPRFERLVGR